MNLQFTLFLMMFCIAMMVGSQYQQDFGEDFNITEYANNFTVNRTNFTKSMDSLKTGISPYIYKIITTYGYFIFDIAEIVVKFGLEFGYTHPVDINWLAIYVFILIGGAFNIVSSILSFIIFLIVLIYIVYEKRRKNK